MTPTQLRAPTTAELRTTEKRVLAWLVAAKSPVSTSELLDSHAGEHMSPVALRRAVWSLIDQGKVAYTPERRLKANP